MVYPEVVSYWSNWRPTERWWNSLSMRRRSVVDARTKTERTCRRGCERKRTAWPQSPRLTKHRMGPTRPAGSADTERRRFWPGITFISISYYRVLAPACCAHPRFPVASRRPFPSLSVRPFTCPSVRLSVRPTIDHTPCRACRPPHTRFHVARRQIGHVRPTRGHIDRPTDGQASSCDILVNHKHP